ncbi:MAG: hypothetical protein NTZ69_13225 [Bacteroidia bacterium]|nr:hypothetical protein [Bacteroidia bacterium]
MTDYFTKIWNNREWIFSGIGVLIISIIGGLILRKRKNEKKLEPHGDGHNYAAETIHIHNSSGLSATDVKELARSVFIENFPKLQEVAKIEAEKNRDLFITELDNKIQEKLNQEEINRFNKPDIQFVLKDAIISASRKDNKENRTILSNLIIDRVKSDGIEFKEIVYNEAINTISRLTKNHLDILAFTFITRYATFVDVKDLDNLEQLLRANICPFINFSSSNAQFQHLEYSDCANISIASTYLEAAFRKSYSNLFLIDQSPFIDKPAYDAWNLQPDLKPIFLRPSDDCENYYFIQRTAEEIQQERDRLIKGDIPDFIDLSKDFLTFVKGVNEIAAEIKSKFDFGERLFKQYNETKVGHLTLTSVGLVIGASHLEAKTGERLDIDIWIN